MRVGDDADTTTTSFESVLYYAFLVGLVIGPHIGYVVQYAEIVQRQNADGYASMVSLILLTSNTLRVYYYLGKRFAFALLLQAALAIVVHLVLLLQVLHVTQVATVPAAYESPSHTQRRRRRRHRVHNNDDDDDDDDVDNDDDDAEDGDGDGGSDVRACHRARRNSGDYRGTATSDNNNNAVALASPPLAATKTTTAAPAAPATPPPPPSSAAAVVNNTATSMVALQHRISSSHTTRQHLRSRRQRRYTRRSRPLALLFECEDVLERSLLAFTPPTFVGMYIFVAALTLIVVLAYYGTMLGRWHAAPEVVGYAALGIESLLLVPQILRNARRHSVDGLTLVLVLTWFGGDVVKLIYFVRAQQPLPFVVSCVVQLLFDCVVVAQVMHYRFGICSNARMRRRRDDNAAGGGDSGGSGGSNRRRYDDAVNSDDSDDYSSVDVVITSSDAEANTTTATTTTTGARATYGAAERGKRASLVSPLTTSHDTRLHGSSSSRSGRGSEPRAFVRARDGGHDDDNNDVGDGGGEATGVAVTRQASNAEQRPLPLQQQQQQRQQRQTQSQPQQRNDGYESSDSLRYLAS